MVFWDCSGLLMWWQIKSTRWLGLLVVIVSVVAAAWVGLAMHAVLTGRYVNRSVGPGPSWHQWKGTAP